jgi:hypothetical protein
VSVSHGLDDLPGVMRRLLPGAPLLHCPQTEVQLPRILSRAKVRYACGTQRENGSGFQP